MHAPSPRSAPGGGGRPSGRVRRPRRAVGQTGLWRWLPGLYTARHYRRDWLWHDTAAGLALTTVLVPVGIAYAVASGLPGIYGLYATIAALVAYALAGPSRILVLGPDSSLAALVAAVVVPLSAGDGERAVALAAAMALVSGAFCLLAGFARLGFVTELLSKPIRHGYMNGIALTVIVSQLPALFGVHAHADGLLHKAWAFAVVLATGQANWVASALGASTLALILLLRRTPRVPGVLVAVVVATLAVSAFDLVPRYHVAVLGALPQGLPALAWPAIGGDDALAVLAGGCAVALVAFADTSVLSRSYAARTGEFVDSNQEMVGLGVANVAAGLLQGFPISASSSRTPVAEAAGARTQLAGVIGAAAVAALLIGAPGLLADLPKAALAAVVIASAIGLVEIAELKRIWRIQRWEFWLSIACSVGVALLGAIPGIGLAIVIALVEFLWHAWRPHHAVLGHVDGVKGYHDVTRYASARTIPGLVLLRWDAPLFFANAEWFEDCVLDAVDASSSGVRWLVVAAEPVTRVDVTAADAIAELDQTLESAGIKLFFAEMKDPVKDQLKRFGLFEQLGEAVFFATVEEAVVAYLKARPVGGIDWEDCPPVDAGRAARAPQR